MCTAAGLFKYCGIVDLCFLSTGLRSKPIWETAIRFKLQNSLYMECSYVWIWTVECISGMAAFIEDLIFFTMHTVVRKHTTANACLFKNTVKLFLSRKICVTWLAGLIHVMLDVQSGSFYVAVLLRPLWIFFLSNHRWGKAPCLNILAQKPGPKESVLHTDR